MARPGAKGNERALEGGRGDHWLVIDGCSKSRAKRQYAQLALAEYGARPEMIVMTHPHRDHAYGLADLIEDVTATDPWPTLGMLPPIVAAAPAAPSTPAAHANGITERAISAIEARWAERPSCRARRLPRSALESDPEMTLDPPVHEAHAHLLLWFYAPKAPPSDAPDPISVLDPRPIPSGIL